MYNIENNFDSLLDEMDDDKLERFINYAKSALEDHKVNRNKAAIQKLLNALREYEETTGEDHIAINHFPTTDEHGFYYGTIVINISDLYIDNNNEFSLANN